MTINGINITRVLTVPNPEKLAGKVHLCRECTCDHKAQWVIQYGPNPEDVTLACDNHLGDIMRAQGDAVVCVWPIHMGL